MACGDLKIDLFGSSLSSSDRAGNDCTAGLELGKKPVMKAASEKPLDSVTSPNDFLAFVGGLPGREFLERAAFHVIEIVPHGRL